jgi:HAD superfamily hydrolase (TIGR01549 family)
MTPIKAIFFDIGDTLVFDDPPLPERLTSAARAAGLTIDAARLPEAFRQAEAFAVQRYVAGIAWDAPGALRETVDVLWQAMGQPPLTETQWAAFGAAFAAVPFTRCVHPGAPALLEELRRRGFLLGAISDWEDTLPDVLATLDLLPYFSALSISACVGVTKPNPLLFEDALAQVNLPPDTCLHVGDWYELDAAGARAAGMNTLLFDWAGRRSDADCPRVTTWPDLADYLLALETG